MVVDGYCCILLLIWCRDEGFTIIDCDKIAHDIQRKGRWGYRRVIAAFGPSVLGRDGGAMCKLKPLSQLWLSTAQALASLSLPGADTNVMLWQHWSSCRRAGPSCTW